MKVISIKQQHSFNENLYILAGYHPLWIGWNATIQIWYTKASILLTQAALCIVTKTKVMYLRNCDIFYQASENKLSKAIMHDFKFLYFTVYITQ